MQALKENMAQQNNKRSHSSPIVNISIFYQNLHYLKNLYKYVFVLQILSVTSWVYKPGKELLVPSMLSRTPRPETADASLEKEINFQVQLVTSNLPAA